VKYADRACALLLVSWFAYVIVAAVFSRPNSPDTIAYGLPGANLVATGRLTMPQLGTQFGFDQVWLLNAPVTVLGCVPFFLVGGTGRVPYLAGVVVLGLVNLGAFIFAGSRLQRSSWTLAVLFALVFLWGRSLPTADLYNQKYSVLSLAVLLVAFLPLSALGSRARHDPAPPPHAAQWFAAGILPLVHVALVVPALCWLCTVLWLWPRSVLHGKARFMYLPGALLSLAWYGRPWGLRLQLLPHLRFGGYRRTAAFGSLIDSAASPLASAPTRIAAVLVVLSALIIIGAYLARKRRRSSLAPVLPAAVALAVLFPLDALHGGFYYAYTVAGAGAVLPLAFLTSGGRRLAAVVLALLGCANAAVGARLDRSRPDWTGTREAVSFLEAQTAATDRLILAPPFVFAAALPTRNTVRVVPQPYFLDQLDEPAWRSDLGTCCDVFVGDPAYYRSVVGLRDGGPPIFERADIRQLSFDGRPVIVARKR
jgi:hypothetical protein